MATRTSIVAYAAESWKRMEKMSWERRVEAINKLTQVVSSEPWGQKPDHSRR